MTRHFCVDTDALKYIDMFQLSRDYEALLERLTGREVTIDPAELHRLFTVETEFFCFVVVPGQLIGVVQASVTQLPTRGIILVTNLVVHDDHEKQGCGRRLMELLEQTAIERWSVPYDQRPLEIVLANYPRRENSEFYQKQGWEPLTPETTEMTRFWQKEIC